MGNTFKFLLLSFLLCANSFAQSRLKDITYISGSNEISVIGYGLVVGLDRDGDTRNARFTRETVTNMLAKFGVEVNDERLLTKNVAAVMVTATIPPFTRKGSKIDVTVSSIGDAKSLKGGTLLLTPLTVNGEDILATAQGPLFVGGENYARRDFSQIKHNHTLVATIPTGAITVQDIASPLVGIKDSFDLFLNTPDFTNAVKVANSINIAFPNSAMPLSPSSIRINIPDEYNNRMGVMTIISQIEQLNIDEDTENKIVVNERTGTIVIGGNVRIKPVAIAHNSLNISIGQPKAVMRKMVNVSANGINVTPQVFTGNNIVLADSTMVNVSSGNITVNPTSVEPPQEEQSQMVTLPATTTIQELTTSLNQLGIAPRDLISILHLLKNSGSLNAQIEVM